MVKSPNLIRLVAYDPISKLYLTPYKFFPFSVLYFA